MHLANPEVEFHANRDNLVQNINNIFNIIGDLKLKCSSSSKKSFELKFPWEEVNTAAGQSKQKATRSKPFDLNYSNNDVIINVLEDVELYLQKLRTRVLENSSKVLITGDLNSGKSTLINAILRQNILPTDQQPCTQLFCEVIPIYNTQAMSKIEAFRTIPLNSDNNADEIDHNQMRSELQNEESLYKWFKIYVQNPQDMNCDHDKMNISLIDSPGLNTDLFKTTSLFDQQQDIDVIVFVVNAAFHLTLSGKEFLCQAAKEKEKIFFVVNKFDEIENSKKCKNLITKQIREILPETFQDAQNLIHFISAKQYWADSSDEDSLPATEIAINQDDQNSKMNRMKYSTEFNNMKESLLNFIYLKRSVSKLAPAKTFCTRLLQDLLELSSFNLRQMKSEARNIESRLADFQKNIGKLDKDEPGLKSELQDITSTTSEKCFAASFYTASAFSDEIPKLINCSKLSGIWNLRANVNLRYQNIASHYSKMISIVEANTYELTQKGLKNIDSISTLYGIRCETNKSIQTHEFHLYSSMPLHKPTILELLYPRDLLRNFGTLNLTSIAGAIFGFQPCVKLAWSFAKRLGVNPIFVSAAIVSGLGAFAIFTATSSIENAVFSQLESYFTSRFNKEIWATDLADRCKQSVAVSLSSKSSQVYITYKNILEKNRQEYSEISEESEKLNIGINYMKDMNKRIEILLKTCSEINL